MIEEAAIDNERILFLSAVVNPPVAWLAFVTVVTVAPITFWTVFVSVVRPLADCVIVVKAWVVAVPIPLTIF